jgi:hypothetical protein
MSLAKQEYEIEHLIQFLKEEFERIISLTGRASGDSSLSDAQALAIWFLHQEVGISYEDANLCVFDETNDCGVDLIWEDKESKRVLVGQVEYDSRSWAKEPANEHKATSTFTEFRSYLEKDTLPDRLHDVARGAWRRAKMLINQNGFAARYYFITPKHFNNLNRERIRRNSNIEEYDFFTHDELLERGEEFLDGQTGMSSFKLPFKSQPLKLEFDYGQVFVASVKLKSIHQIVESHAKEKKLRALFASNVRSYLNVKKRSKDIGDAIRSTISQKPDEFLVCNNGITIQCSRAVLNDDHIFLERASISNGCQTVMNIDRYFRENEGETPNAEVLVTVIELRKNAANISSEVAIARNYQNPVDNRDLKSNNPLMVTLHHRLFAEKLKDSDKRYYLLRKQGEKQVVLKEEQNAKWKYFWMDADDLARCISAVLRENPFISQQGTNDLFGKYFPIVFPAIHDPSHNRCKYAYWLVEMIKRSYDRKARWKGVKDDLIKQQKDFKQDATWPLSSLIAHQIKNHFCFEENLENKFVAWCEKWRFSKPSQLVEEFEETTFEMIDDAFRLLHAISKPLLGRRLPKSKGIYSKYDDLFKGSNYEFIRLQISKNEKVNYQKTFRRSMARLVQFLKEN